MSRKNGYGQRKRSAFFVSGGVLTVSAVIVAIGRAGSLSTCICSAAVRAGTRVWIVYSPGSSETVAAAKEAQAAPGTVSGLWMMKVILL